MGISHAALEPIKMMSFELTSSKTLTLNTINLRCWKSMHVFKYKCVFMCVQLHLDTWVFGGQKTTSVVIPQAHPPCFKAGSSLALYLPSRLGWADYCLGHPPISASYILGLQVCPTMSSFFYMSSGGLNLDPHTCKASTLLCYYSNPIFFKTVSLCSTGWSQIIAILLPWSPEC